MKKVFVVTGCCGEDQLDDATQSDGGRAKR